MATSLATPTTADNATGLSKRLENFKPEQHNLFLSHAGEDKTFVRMLHEELQKRKHSPFLDKEPDSLPPGSHFPSTIYAAIAKCQVIIVILSEKFVIKKWPMLELVAAWERQCVEKRPIILPVFYKLHVDKINMLNLCKWKEEHWARLSQKDDAVNLDACLEALQDLQKISGIVKSDSEDDFDFAKKVATAICKMVTPNKPWANDAMESREKFCDKLSGCMLSDGNRNCTFFGMWGKTGTGKTCIAMALCNHFYQEYCGWVFLVDLFKKTDKVAVGTALYRELHGAKFESSISEDEHVLAQQLEDLIKDKSFFLVLDNPAQTEHGKGMVEYVLDRLKFCKECKVLITAREEKFIDSWLQPYSNEATVVVEEVPYLDSEAAARILLRTACPKLNWDTLDSEEQEAIQEVCTSNLEDINFHPLLTKMLGKYISRSGKNSKPLTSWPALIEADAEFKRKLDTDIFSLLNDQFQSMTANHLQAFSIDAALYDVSIETSLRKICKWLSILYGCRPDTVWKKLERVRENELLYWDDDEDDPEIDTNMMFANFAKQQVLENPEKWGWFFYHGTAAEEALAAEALGVEGFEEKALDFEPPTPKEVKMIEKIALVEGRFQDVGEVLNLTRYSKAIALVLSRCENVEELDVQWNKNMRVLEVDQCDSLKEIEGLQDLTQLVCLRICDTPELDLSHMGFQRLLRLQKLEISGTAMREAPNLQGCSKLEELILSENQSMQCLPECWSGFPRLTKIDFSCNDSILELPDLSPLAANLRSLDISYCDKLKSAACISSLTALETLCMDECPALKPLPDLKPLINLILDEDDDDDEGDNDEGGDDDDEDDDDKDGDDECPAPKPLPDLKRLNLDDEDDQDEDDHDKDDQDEDDDDDKAGDDDDDDDKW